MEKLEASPPLGEVPRAALEAMADRAREVSYREGERLVPLLEPPQQILVIHDGLAKLVGISSNGVERIVYVFRPGDITGSRVLLDSPEAPYEIAAISPVEAIAVSKRDMLSLGREHPEVLLAITRQFSRRLSKLTQRVMSAMSEEVPVRLSQLLIDFAEEGGDCELVPLVHPLTHEMMAQIVGASRPHTSTVLGDLEEAGAVRREGRRGLSVRVDRLSEIVERGRVSETEALVESDRLRSVPLD